MAGRRSLAGVGQVTLIYTIGTDDPYADGRRPSSWNEPILTASVGEDFADCRWPVTIKASASVTARALHQYVQRLAKAVNQGFFIDPSHGHVLYWRWDGRVPLDMPLVSKEAESPRDSGERTVGTGRRSESGKGSPCAIYLLDERAHWQTDDFYGRYQSETAISGTVDEDFADSSWPVVLKVHHEVSRQRLEDYLLDFMAALEDGLYYRVAGLTDNLGKHSKQTTG